MSIFSSITVLQQTKDTYLGALAIIRVGSIILYRCEISMAGFKTAREGLVALWRTFDSDKAAGWTCTIQINITDEGEYHLEIRNQQCILHDGPAEKPDLILTTSRDNWLAICQGPLHPFSAFMGGRLTSQGDMAHLMKMQTVFKFS
ncbi:MAG: SCP2 sterol-binding domain-containing protein [Promethearchaeota archaeon]